MESLNIQKLRKYWYNHMKEYYSRLKVMLSNMKSHGCLGWLNAHLISIQFFD